MRIFRRFQDEVRGIVPLRRSVNRGPVEGPADGEPRQRAGDEHAEGGHTEQQDGHHACHETGEGPLVAPFSRREGTATPPCLSSTAPSRTPATMPRVESSRKRTKPIQVKKENPNSRLGTVSNPSRAQAANVTTASLLPTPELPVFTSTAVYSRSPTSEHFVPMASRKGPFKDVR